MVRTQTVTHRGGGSVMLPRPYPAPKVGSLASAAAGGCPDEQATLCAKCEAILDLTEATGKPWSNA